MERITKAGLWGFVAMVAIGCSSSQAGVGATADPLSSIVSYPHREVCAHKPGQMRCHARVRTDVHGNAVRNATPSGFGPADLRSAYNLPSTGGSGKTIAIVDAFDNPNAESDLGKYRSQFGLPPCTTANGCFRKVNEQGQPSPLPTADSGWGSEISLDLDMASAVCPSCNLLLVEASQASTDDLGTSVNTAVALGASVVSNSYGGSEDGTIVTADSKYFDHPGVLITASSGDSGFGVQYPASSAHVTAVGGTSLVKSSSARGWSEGAWNGAGSGCSGFIAKPSWQHDSGCSMRMEADVSAVADPNTGVAVYDGGWTVYGGTSVASPVVAAVYALTGNVGVDGSYSYVHTSFFNDVTSGSNGSCSPSYECTAGVGYDGPTGNGTPNGSDMAGTASQGDFSLALSPASATVQAGSSTTFDLTASLTSGSAQNVALAVSGLPQGVSGSFNPASITSNGGSSTLTLTAAAGAPSAQNVAFTVTGTGTTATHTASGSLTVTGGQGGGNLLGNAGFETGDLTDWTLVKGFVSASSAVVHSGSFSALVGRQTAYNGNSVLTQSVTVPATGTTTLSFWGNYVCPGASTNEYARVWILNSTNHRLAQVIKQCDNNMQWEQTSLDLTPYAGQTIILQFLDRDDGSASDPTYWYLDDVSVTNQ